MKTVLVSTTAGWNCGDDWIRVGLLRALELRPDVDVIYWNRGWGIDRTYANAPRVNLPLTDYVIVAGSPEWVENTEPVYEYCTATDTPVALLGVGKTGGYDADRHGALMDGLVSRGLLDAAIARDPIAAETLARIGVPDVPVLCDPAVFYPPSVPGGDLAVVGWRGFGNGRPLVPYVPDRLDGVSGVDALPSTYFRETWKTWEERRRIVTVHDNREIAAARSLFGRDAVRYRTDPAAMMRLYERCGAYVGGRIHGFVASVIHGGTAHLVYRNQKARCADILVSRLGLEGSAAVTILRDDETDPIVAPELVRPSGDGVWRAIRRELRVFRRTCRAASPRLAALMK